MGKEVSKRWIVKKLIFASLFAITVLFFASLPPFSAFSEETYPQIDILGYKKYQYTKLDVDPIQNLFPAQTMLGGYYGSSPLQESLKLNIIGRLNEKLSVSYDLEQQPDMPEKFDVKVTYDKTELTFGDFQANFTENEFASTSKFLNGVMITSKDNWYNMTLVPSAKLKSETQGLVSQKGANSKGPYNLGHGSIIEDSERIELNNVLLERGTDYTIDYFSGKITFSRILSPDDTFTYSYEFTNLLDLFFPTVSKRDFVGFEGNIIVDPALLGVPARKIEKSIRNSTEYFPTILTIPEESLTREVVVLSPTVEVFQTQDLSGYAIYINHTPAFVIHDITDEAPAKAKIEMIYKRLSPIVAQGISTDEVKLSEINGQSVLVIKGQPIVTVSIGEARINNTSTADLGYKWIGQITQGLMATPETIERLVTPEIGLEETEWESTGTYHLKNSPIIPYSEKITYMGTQLKKFEDYLINYQDGSVTLLRPDLPTPTEPLIVDYQHVEVASESETLPGTGKGPYSLAFEDIIEGSELLYVNNIPYVRDLDYKIDYKTGKLSFFTNIPSTANIVVKYKHLLMTAPPASVTPAVPRSLKVGVSYLKESGKRGATAPSVAATETKSGSDVIKENNVLYLNLRPLTGTGEVVLEMNGTTLVYGVDYVIPQYDAVLGKVTPEVKMQYVTDLADISDGVKTGTIKILRTVTSTDEFSVSYDYYKWSQDRYTGFGSGGTLTYFMGNTRNLVPGQEQVQIWRKNDPNPVLITLQRNSSTKESDGHYKINYSDPPNITFNNDPITAWNPKTLAYETFNMNDISFTIIYKFIADASVSEKPLEHEVVGFDTAFKVGDYLNLEGAFARSKTDQVLTTIATNESFYGNGVDKKYTLHSPGQIIDGSEQVFVNGQKLNRDDQYAFFYDSGGIITFYNITPATLDAISVDYSYQSSSGTVTGLNEKQGNAFKLAGSIKPMSNLEVAADYKKIDADFSPMGGTSIPLGSDFKHAYTKMTPIPQFWPSFWFSGDVKESTVPIGNYNDKYLRSYDRNLATGFNTFGIAQVDFGYRDYTTLDDRLTKIAPHNNDYRSQAYALSITPRPLSYGEFAFTNKNDAKKTLTFTDTEDKVLPQDSVIDYYHTNNAFDLTRRARWVLDYQVNQPSVISYEAGGRSKGKTIERKEVDDLSSYFNMDLTFGGFKRLYTYVNTIGHNENDFIAGTLRSTVNETIHADFVPIDQISTSIDHNRQEVPTVSTAYGNPKTERSAANIRVTPFSSTGLGWSGSKDDSLQENGSKTSGTSNTYSIDHIPVSNSLYKLSTKYLLSSSLRTAPSGVDTRVTTDTRTFGQDYTLTLTPISSWTITSGFGQEDYTNKNNASVSPIDTKSQAQTTRVGTAYKLTSDLDLSTNYSVKVTRIPDDSAHKSLIDAHAIYKILTNGTLNYDWSQEDNGGEVLAGAFSTQDFKKIINSLSLNYILPQEQMVLSSIVLKAAVKWANFIDNLNEDASFQASLLTFEGTINF